MPMRYSGNVKIRVTYHEGTHVTYNQFPNGYYDCHLSWPGGKHFVRVGAPRSLSVAVDSPKAYDDAAAAAVTFANDSTREGEITGDFEPDGGMHGASISRRK